MKQASSHSREAAGVAGANRSGELYSDTCRRRQSGASWDCVRNSRRFWKSLRLRIMTEQIPITVRPFRTEDTDAVIALWQSTGLVRPWNDPQKDIARKL